MYSLSGTVKCQQLGILPFEVKNIKRIQSEDRCEIIVLTYDGELWRIPPFGCPPELIPIGARKAVDIFGDEYLVYALLEGGSWLYWDALKAQIEPRDFTAGSYKFCSITSFKKLCNQ
eukprot:TRINITY_DN3099_c0_g2_i1.p1 TRINITY_DN3099_c0_g2~~TRINITY_DN3099_c0_g2_i1.p1  ORF type:complete len:117 (-),score=3.31 TRINITY_DN3099_c0_g2_i1:73-423(-)